MSSSLAVFLIIKLRLTCALWKNLIIDRDPRYSLEMRKSHIYNTIVGTGSEKEILK
jgi:hypothetical protein